MPDKSAFEVIATAFDKHADVHERRKAANPSKSTATATLMVKFTI
jgi:hypothetical protein